MERAVAQLAQVIAEGVPNGCIGLQMGALRAPSRAHPLPQGPRDV
ncbi:hypothetical protein DW66_4639 [Pseudomonas putida]|nr:hypothetical protein DW66_4639 [Pseudomonas putida]AJG11784.1 hypothetical protein RK21_00276 [Pseudomonas plecoglossicida]